MSKFVVSQLVSKVVTSRIVTSGKASMRSGWNRLRVNACLTGGLVSLCVMSALVHADTQMELAKEGKQLIQKFAGELKTELKGAVKAGGLTNGIEVCSIKASALALANNNSRWQISRTSLKPRNQENQPTTDETMVLLQFEQKLKAGNQISDLVYTRQNEDGSFHMMKAIPTQGLCLACHGQNISADVQKLLTEKYPQDKATGYQEGQIRGAFSLTYTP